MTSIEKKKTRSLLVACLFLYGTIASSLNAQTSNTVCSNYYTISSSDTCLYIAAAFSITYADLLSLNPGLNCQYLPVGQAICVPNIATSVYASSSSSCSNYYRLFYGDSCDTIASAYQITTQTLLALNPTLNCQSLPIGQIICVPSLAQQQQQQQQQQSYPSSCANYYQLFTGDSCDTIAAAFRVTTQTLLALNPTLNCLSLPIGQYICVPSISSSGGSTGQSSSATFVLPSCLNYYRIYSGDSCDTIASAYQVTTQTLYSLNPQGLNCQSLQSGQVICVPPIQGASATTTPSQQVIANPSSCTNYYLLFYGDSCDTIASAYQITTQTLLALNPTLNCQSLPIGQIICVPSLATSSSTTSCANYYQLFVGDSCPTIASAFGTTVQGLVALNPTLNCQTLPVGQYICVPAIGGGSTTAAATTTTCNNYYRIFGGDSCDVIASAFRITTQALLALNPTLNCQSLPVGQIICVPSLSTSSSSSSTLPTCANYYQLFVGDSCDTIAAAFRVSTQTLLSLNPSLNCQTLPVGQYICVPSLSNNNVVVATTPAATTFPTCSNYYQLCSVDTCASISAAYGITLQQLYYLNPSINCQSLAVGQYICVPSVNAPTTTATPPVTYQPTTACQNYYLISAGDTCTSVAQRYGTTTQTICSLNPGIDCQQALPAGRYICLPLPPAIVQTTSTTAAPYYLPSCSSYYLVCAEDSWSSIARRYAITQQALCSLNPTLNCQSALSYGQYICVPSPTLPATTTTTTTAAAPVTTTLATYTCSKYYQIAAGDSCASIAAAFGISYQTLCSFNPGLNCPAPTPGQYICLPYYYYYSQPAPLTTTTTTTPTPVTTYPTCQNYYYVCPGDTCSSIAARYGVTAQTICSLNANINCQSLASGQYICVPSVSAITSTATTTTSTAAPAPTATSYYYQVCPGDTCASIASRYGTSVQALSALNPTINCQAPLTSGQYICVPIVYANVATTTTPSPVVATTSVASCTNYYQVNSGDTFASIASKYGISVQTLCSLNPSINCQSLTPGQYIRICNGSSQQSAVATTTTTTITPTASCTNYYSVCSMDNCANIAYAFNMTVSDLYSLNAGLNCQSLTAGQKLCVSSKKPATTSVSTVSCQAYYEVKYGDTCYNLAMLSGNTFERFCSLNPGINCSSLQIGQRVCVCSSQCSRFALLSQFRRSISKSRK